MVTEQILDVAREFAKEAPMLTNAVFYFDGFAGFTPYPINSINIDFNSSMKPAFFILFLK